MGDSKLKFHDHALIRSQVGHKQKLSTKGTPKSPSVLKSSARAAPQPPVSTQHPKHYIPKSTYTIQDFENIPFSATDAIARKHNHTPWLLDFRQPNTQPPWLLPASSAIPPQSRPVNISHRQIHALQTGTAPSQPSFTNTGLPRIRLQVAPEQTISRQPDTSLTAPNLDINTSNDLPDLEFETFDWGQALDEAGEYEIGS